MNPVLTQTTRSGLVEKQDRGAVSVVGPGGTEVFALGDTATPVYPRSALKFVQVLPLLASDAVGRFGFTPDEIALMCGSHNGEPEHIATARSILAKAGVPADALRCGTHRPLFEAARDNLVRRGLDPEPIHNNCSGKHAGFLAVCRLRGWDLEYYLDPAHPLQREIRSDVCRLFEMSEDELIVGVDGCTAPNYAMPLRNMAAGFANLVAGEPTSPPTAAMIAAVTTHPHMVAGTKRYCTDLMRAAEGRVIAKVGADGVYCVGLRDPRLGVAIKIEAGTTGPQYNVAQAVVEALGVFPDGRPPSLERFFESPVSNCRGEQVGSRTVSAELSAALAQLGGRAS